MKRLKGIKVITLIMKISLYLIVLVSIKALMEIGI